MFAFIPIFFLAKKIFLAKQKGAKEMQIRIYRMRE
jgi:hypothetical protein